MSLHDHCLRSNTLVAGTLLREQAKGTVPSPKKTVATKLDHSLDDQEDQ